MGVAASSAMKSLTRSGARKVLVCALCAIALVELASAQSGRKQPRVSGAPPIQPPAESEPPPKPSSDQPKKPEFFLVLAKAPNVAISNIYARAAMESCAERLKRSKMVEFSVAPSELNRKEASERAKADPKTYVALMDFGVDNFGGADIISARPDQIVIDFTVFTPGTGKVKTSGRVYQRYRNALPVPGQQPGSWYSLEEAGRETAERILGAIDLSSSPGVKPGVSS